MSIVKQSLVGASGQGGGYTIDDSLRFRSSASAYLSRTPASAGNQKTWTWSGWVKRSSVSSTGYMFGARTGVGGTYFLISISSAHDLRIESNSETSYPLYKTNALFRDPSAWYHFVVALDMTQATSTNRLKVYVNGVLQTTASYNVPAQNTNLAINSTQTHLIGQQASAGYFDGYQTEVNFIDGQALDPTDFGEFDDNGTWKPLAYTGTYGTNGFYLNGVGVTDQSGNGNNWTNNNLNLSTSTATTYDQMKDTPSLVDENAGNFAVLNPLRPQLASGVTYTNGNLTVYLPTNASYYPHAFSNMGVSSGKFYWEVNIASLGPMIGIGDRSDTLRTNWFAYNNGSSNSVVYHTSGNLYYPNTIVSGWGEAFTGGDVIGVALDMDAGTITFYKNNVSQGVARTGLSGEIFAGINIAGAESPTTSFNFGQRPFAYTPPSGFLKLNTFNLPDSTIEDGSQYFAATTYTGNSSDPQSIGGLNFQPDMVWVKARSVGTSHVLSDAVRGATKTIYPDTTLVEATASLITAFNSDGFDVSGGLNASPRTFVGWNWKANGSGVLNEVGDIDSTVSANTTAGFSIVTYTGTGANTTVGHGLGVAPKFIFLKSRTTAEPWLTYHGSLGGTQYIFLNQTNKAFSNIAYFNNTDPTSTVFSLGNSAAGNTNNANYVAYCFAEVEGYSAFGIYTGNASTDGPFVYTGFRPAFVMVKSSNATEEWMILDAARDTYNVMEDRLFPNSAVAESSVGTIDFTSNGFKLKRAGGTGNISGRTYIYIAFAENPFKNANAR